jgi:methylaspartate mutase epsilon subunit
MSGSAAAHTPIDEVRVTEECGIIRREVEEILESVLLSGRGSVAEGIVEGFRRGFLDVPFSPSIYNRGAVMTARDREGAVRFLAFGNLQFERELREFHREKMDERRRAEGLLSEKQNYLIVERDVLQIARGLYERWPLSDFENKSVATTSASPR